MLIKSLILLIDKTKEQQDYHAFIYLSTNQNRAKGEKVTSQDTSLAISRDCTQLGTSG